MKSFIRYALIISSLSFYNHSSWAHKKKVKQKKHQHSLSLEKKNISLEFNNLVSMQQLAVDQYKNRPIFGTKIKDKYEWITYKEFGEKVDHLRGGLAKLGVSKDDKVAIIADNSDRWAMSCYATLGLGAAFVPMYTNQSVDEWKFKVSNSDAKVLLVANEEIYQKVISFKDELDGLEHIYMLSDGEGHHFDQLQKEGKNNPHEAIVPSPDDLMGLIYTSGTTGDPKGVMLTHGNVVSLLKGLPKAIDIKNERSLSFLPWAHIFGQLAELHSLLLLGNSAGFAQNPQTIVQNMSEVHPSVFFSVPKVFNKIYEKAHTDATSKSNSKLKRLMFKNWEKTNENRRSNKKTSFFKRKLAAKTAPIISEKFHDAFGGKLKYALSGGAKLDPTVANFMEDLDIIVLEGYGMSETSGIISLNTLKDRKIGSVGKPFPGVEVRIDHSVMENPRKAKEEGKGEIIVCGENIMVGYYKLPEKTLSDMTEDGCLKTGDIGYFDDEGYLFVTGRIKEIYKLLNGKYIVPGPIETKVKLSPYFADAFLFGTNRPHNVLLANVDEVSLKSLAQRHGIANESKDKWLENDQIKQILNKELVQLLKGTVHYAMPKSIKLISEDWSDLMTPTMKLKRNLVEKRYKSALDSLYELN